MSVGLVGKVIAEPKIFHVQRKTQLVMTMPILIKKNKGHCTSSCKPKGTYRYGYSLNTYIAIKAYKRYPMELC